ncbi:hypothetical protein MRX96_036674 [Rhipicephalus microplus]
MNEFNATADDDQASKPSTDDRSDGSWSRSRFRSRPKNRTMRVSRSRSHPRTHFRSARKVRRSSSSDKKTYSSPSEEAVDNAAEILREHKALMCSKPGHQENLLKLLLTKFFRRIFTNFALKATDKHDVAKLFEIKPLSRKILKL